MQGIEYSTVFKVTLLNNDNLCTNFADHRYLASWVQAKLTEMDYTHIHHYRYRSVARAAQLPLSQGPGGTGQR